MFLFQWTLSLLMLVSNEQVAAFSPPSSSRLHIHQSASLPRSGSGARLVVLYDRSATTWFAVGDSVIVVDDVLVNGGTKNVRGRKGKVIETWEKCDVDPTCCCAEQVDTNMAVRVEFEQEETTPSPSNDEGSKQNSSTKKFTHFFAEEELAKVA